MAEVTDSGTYDQATITRRQKIAEQMLADSSKPRVIRNPVEGLGYLANVGADAFALNRLDKQAGEARKADTAALMSILNGGGAAPSPSAVASPSPAPAMPPPSPSVIGANGPSKPDAQGVYDSDAVMMPPPQPDFGKAVAGIESGGKYDAMGPVTKTGDQAYGKYQVMGANVPAWTREHIGREMTPQEFLASPEAQDAVFKGQFGKYASAYGPEGAARAWFAGEGGMNDPGRKDQLGTTVQSYGDQFTKNMGGPGAVAAAMSPSAALPPANAPAPSPSAPSPSAPGALPTNQPAGIPPQQRQAIAALMMATPGSPAQQLGIQLAAQSLKPRDYGFQTLPDGTILRTDPHQGTVAPIYQAPVKPELKDTGTDPLTGQKSFAEYNPQAHTLKPMGGANTAQPSDQVFSAIASAKERGAPQEELYKLVPESLRTGVKAMIEGKSIPTNLSMRGAARDATLRYAHAVDENFDEMLIPQRKTFATSMGSQQISSFGGQVRSAGTIVKHLGGAGEALNTLEGSGALNETLPVLNKPQIALKAQSGDKKFNDALGKWETNVEGIAGELTQLLTGGVGAEHTKQEWRNRLDIRSQPISKVKASLDAAAGLMMGRLSNVAQAKERAYQTPTDPLSLLGKDEQAIMQRLKAGTYQGEAKTEPTAAITQTATNPQTGERVQLNPKTGQWEPLK